MNLTKVISKLNNLKIKKIGPCVTVSGISGSGKSTSAKSIAKALNLKYVNIGYIIRDFAIHNKISLEDFSSIVEPEIDYESDKRLLMLAMKGNCVLDGRLAAWISGEYSDCKLFFVCSQNVRARRTAGRDNLTFETALKKNHIRDNEDIKRYKKLYDIDILDTSIYDEILDTSDMTMNEMNKNAIKITKKILNRKIKI